MTTTHLCIDIRGVLRWPVEELRGLVREGKRELQPMEAQQYLIDQLALGRRFLPTHTTPCEGFTYEAGCPGHSDPEVET